MRQTLLRTLLFLILPCSVNAQSVQVSSENIKKLLEEKNPKVWASKLSLEAAGKREGFFIRSFLPSIELYGAQESFKKGRSPQKNQPAYGAQAELNLFNSGRDFLENKNRSLESARRGFMAKRVQSEELEKVRTMFWQIRYLQEKAVLLKETIEVNQRNLNSAQRRVKSGVATDSDRFEFEMKDVDLRRELAEAQVQIASELRLLSVHLGLDGAPINLAEELVHDHSYEDELKHSLNEHEYLFKESEIKSEQLALLATSHRRVWWPKLDAYANYNQYNQREEDLPNALDRKETVIGLKLTMSLPAGFESMREASSLSLESQAASAMADFEKQEAGSHLMGEMAALKLLHTQVHDAEENIKRSQNYYKITQSEYGRGVKNSPDVLGAAEKLFNMQHKRIEIIRDFHVAKAHVLSKIGK